MISDSSHIVFKKNQIDKFLNILRGLIIGIKSDGIISKLEIAELYNWCLMLGDLRFKKPFSDLISIIDSAISDNYLTLEESYDILWVINKFTDTDNTEYSDPIKLSLSELKGILHGVLSDNLINISEISDLKFWLERNCYLVGYYPYDEIFTLLESILIDGFATEDEVNILKVYFSEFIDKNYSMQIDFDNIEALKDDFTIEGICALSPNISFQNKNFSFSGPLCRATRSEVQEIIETLGGNFNKSVNSDTNYLVVGNNDCSCWAYSCYGRKVELALIERRKGSNISIISEIDFWESVAQQ